MDLTELQQLLKCFLQRSGVPGKLRCGTCTQAENLDVTHV